MAVQTAPAALAGQSNAQSILAADFGSVNTRVVLLDIVGGEYRLLSRAQTLTTSAPPLVDVGIGLRRALDEMSGLIGRKLAGGKDELVILHAEEGSGVDAFLTTASGGRPMKVVLVGLMPDVSVASGRKALASLHVELVDTLSLADVRSPQDQINAIVRSQPDVIFIVGGMDFGATEAVTTLLQTVRMAIVLIRDHKPAVLFAGNQVLRPTVQQLLGAETMLYQARNVRASLNGEDLSDAQLELALLYGSYKSASTGGFEEVQKASQLGVLPTAQSYNTVLRYLGELMNASVMCVDVGSSSVTVCANIRKTPYVSIRSDLGLGHSAVAGVRAVGVRNIQRWLTFDAQEVDVMDYAWNKFLRPSTIPQTSADLELEYAMAREMLRSAVATARSTWDDVPSGDLLPPMRLIIGAGSVLAQSVDAGLSAMLMLDSLQSTGISELWLDPYGMLAALGSVAYVAPLAVVQLLESSGLTRLGTAISPLGRHAGGTAIQANIKYADGKTAQVSVPGGDIRLVTLPTGQKAQVTIKLSRGLTINGKGRITLTAEGGTAGLVLDARGRPLVVPKDVEKRKDLLPRWYAAVRGAK
ncbi:MAG: glutamate mutase L [Anaerolineae bacterium]|nr:glutamate mutase L [Anaerolineae bacterium]